MSVTAIVTNHDYGRFLAMCLDSAFAHCDEVLVYDDGSTDESASVLALYPDAVVSHRDDASGGPMWGSNLGIEQASCDHFLFLDADNVLIEVPQEFTADYTYADIMLIDSQGWTIGWWEYPDWPKTAEACLEKFRRELCIPVPWGGVWSTDFVRRNNLRWSEWPSSPNSSDWRTCVDWLTHGPTIDKFPRHILAFRQHPEQESENIVGRMSVLEDALALAESML